ncbi:MAG: DivIVA domain-containing protein [Acidimicrobiia bacterium]
MALTPIDVQQKTFGTALRGYDLDEVDDFLDEVVTSLKGYEQRLAEAQARIQGLETELAGKGDSESAISRALVAAQRSADMIIEDANREAERLLTDARTQSEMLAAVREEERAKLDLEVSSMKAGVAEIRDKVRALAGSMASDLDQMESSVATAEAQLAGGATTSSPDSSVVAMTAAGAAVAADAISNDHPDTADAAEPDEALSADDIAIDSQTEAFAETVTEAGEVSEVDVESDPWSAESGQAVESDLDAWVTPQPEDVAGAVAESRWAPSWSDEIDIETAAQRDPLEEALAEATFADLEGADLEGADEVDLEVDLEVEVEIEEVVEVAEEEIATADALQTDDVEAGEAWERAGLEGWGETNPSPDDDRPRRPWE